MSGTQPQGRASLSASASWKRSRRWAPLDINLNPETQALLQPRHLILALRHSFETEGSSPVWPCMGSHREPNSELQRYRAADRASRKCPQGPSAPYKAMSLPRYTLDSPLLRPSGIQAILRPYTEDGSMVPVHPSRRKPGATSASGQRTPCVGSALRAQTLRRRP